MATRSGARQHKKKLVDNLFNDLFKQVLILGTMTIRVFGHCARPCPSSRRDMNKELVTTMHVLKHRCACSERLIGQTSQAALVRLLRTGDHAPEKVGLYVLGRTVGVGSFGKVNLGRHVVTGEKVAVKIFSRKKISCRNMDEKVQQEINMMRNMTRQFMHPRIMPLHDVIVTPNYIFVIMEYAPKGDLFNLIVQKGRLSEKEARCFFQQIISGVEYCYEHRVVHRDLKPENLMIEAGYNIKIADFGLSNIMRDGLLLKTSCGSPNYAAPELISQQQYVGLEVDIWSCGVILYAMLCGCLPFDEPSVDNVFKKIRGGIYTLPSYISPGARDLTSRMLVVDPIKRITIPEIWQHPWLAGKHVRTLAGKHGAA
eukprot:gnl/MRDRNA2_/MRDRNA2_84008_c0_seq1.p1 gnl/MRDRNA2_/MRDRNA2_84008_c0~~gnl/MRDRNA2_/MRDRNA2_84008_c0_seq1.p1  ORF type:complete len:427 (+),score=34.70 gnl/MRDRNA2_/MRDRNA2_84008_c0_seq1:172-1281(+)